MKGDTIFFYFIIQEEIFQIELFSTSFEDHGQQDYICLLSDAQLQGVVKWLVGYDHSDEDSKIAGGGVWVVWMFGGIFQ